MRDPPLNLATNQRKEKVMKPTKCLLVVLTLCGIYAERDGQSQTYNVDTAIDGSSSYSMTMIPGDGNFTHHMASGRGWADVSRLTETVTLNTGAATIRQTGNIFLEASTTTMVLNDTQQIAVFPNPPTSVTGQVSITLSFAGANLAFDTGPRAVTYSGSGSTYNFDGGIGEFIHIPITGSYTLATGGGSYTGSFNYTINGGNSFVAPHGAVRTFSQISTADYPNSISLTGMGATGGFSLQGPSVVNFTAPNGFHLRLDSGLYDDFDYPRSDSWSWSPSEVPEPSAAGFFFLGIAGLLTLRRCRARGQ